MTDYNVKFTNTDNTPILVQPNTVNKDYSITFFGRTKLKYGRDMNENLLHLLENFACREDSENPGNPDVAIAVEELLETPVIGQTWLNSTTDVPYFWDGDRWVPFGMVDDYAANSGRISHGNTIPLPISQNGYEFSADECVWIVSPSNLPEIVDYFICETDSDALVTMQYSLTTSSSLVSGCANYLIVGIRYNTIDAELPPDISPTPTPTPQFAPKE